ncbi:hypothetical protein QTI12_03315 [Clostridium perfringens]|nr:hypothetical protein [Clostridium perfringens]
MNRKEIIGQLEDLLYNFKNFESIETTDDDVVALEFAINELKGTAQEVPVQEQSIIINFGDTTTKLSIENFSIVVHQKNHQVF